MVGRWASWVVVAALALAACGGRNDEDGGVDERDDGVARDAGRMDAGGDPDAGADSGPAPDLGVDAGVLPECIDLLVPIRTDAPAADVVTHSESPDRFADDLEAPYPTTAWWTPLVVRAGSVSINAFPYLLQTTNAGLFVSAPRIADDSFRRGSTFTIDWRLSSQEPITDRELIAYDDLSATVEFQSANGTIQAPLLHGMPYVSLRYDGLTPRLEASSEITTVDGEAPGTVTGDRFAVALANGQTWLVYASSEATFRVEGTALVMSGTYDGWVRVALLPDGADAAILDDGAGAIPTGGRIALQGCFERNEGELDFAYTTEGEGDLLMLAMPHHDGLLGEDETRPGLTYPTFLGEMFGVVGDVWTMIIEMDDTGFDAPRDIAPNRVDDVRTALTADQNLVNESTGPYFGGKQVAAMGRLALIADALGEDEVAVAIRTRLVTQVGPWLAGTMERLRYDRTWGGIVAEGSERDPGVFFGQGYYNDHHFHYGYHLYAAAALGREDAAWLAANRENVDVLARDIANPSDEDPFFTPFRSLDWYVGHSNASGLFVFRRNQESTSEAVNAWYALALWARVTGRPELNLLGRLMTAQEILAARTYWHIEEGSPIYGDGPFSENRVVGILYDSSAEYTTFFGTNVEFIHGIQYLPFTPVTERLLDPTWMSQAYPVVAEALTRPSPVIAEGWRGFIVMARATFETDEAWDEAQTLTAYDDGNSRANTLWWIATRP